MELVSGVVVGGFLYRLWLLWRLCCVSLLFCTLAWGCAAYFLLFLFLAWVWDAVLWLAGVF